MPQQFGSYSGYEPDSREQWLWWEWLILPLALAAHAFQIVVPWAKTQGILKLFLTFMVMWTIFGLVAVTLDSKAGSGEMPRWVEVSHERGVYSGPYRRDCMFNGGVAPLSGVPLGKLYTAGTTCAAYVPYQLALNLGADSLAGMIAHIQTNVYYAYWSGDGFTVSYLFLGMIFFWTMATLPVWLLLLLAKALIGNLHVSWGD